MNTPSHPESPTSCNLQVKDSKKEVRTIATNHNLMCCQFINRIF